jgi:ABC-type uncharacterized transport system ATPase subunit
MPPPLALLQLAVRQLNLAIEKGECFGLLGPNGAGKSTSINMMVRADPSIPGDLAGGCAFPSQEGRFTWGSLLSCFALLRLGVPTFA